MKNFARALRFAWQYRWRLIFSLCCALIAAALWGLNFTAVYPVLKILGSNMNLHEWVDRRISDIEVEITNREKELENNKKIEAEFEKLPIAARDPERAKDIADHLTRVEHHLSKARSRQWRHIQLKEQVIKHLPEDRFNTMAVLLGFVILAVALKGVFEYFQETAVGYVVTRSIYDIRNLLYQKAIHQDLRQVQEGGSADMMSKFTNDTEVVGNGLKILCGRVVAEPLRAFACLGIAMWISWQLTLLFVLIVPASVYIMTVASKKMKRATRRVLDKMSALYKILQESFQGLRIVKAFTMETYERRRFRMATKDYAAKSMRVIRIDALTGPLVELTGVFAISLALLAGAYLVMSGERTIFGVKLTSSSLETETLLWLYAQLIGMADPIRKLSSVYTKIQAGAAAADRVFTIMDREPEVHPNPHGPKIERHCKDIEFQNVCFSYARDKQVLTNICMRVRAGETICIVGANGSGKSTLLNLLPRFYDPDHGTVFIDGIDIRKANLRSLRRQIAIVSQDPILFDDTLGNNIRYGSRSATDAEVEDAAKKAFAHDFIMAKGGYGVQLGDNGGTALSGGEKQRIALARAMLRDPSILLLDEFSSAIDPVSDRLIHDALAEFKKGRTTFFITHKMHTVQLADRVIVLDNHEIVATGTHAECLAQSPVYRGLYEAQIQAKAA